MTKAELIAALADYPDDMAVKVDDTSYGNYGPIHIKAISKVDMSMRGPMGPDGTRPLIKAEHVIVIHTS